MWMIDKENNKICYSDGKFHTNKTDWNHDRDVYTDTVMIIHYIDGGYIHIHEYEMKDYEMVSEDYIRDKLYEELNSYFLQGDNYYCDPTCYGNHYGDYGFLKGGHCVYKDKSHREKAIQKEIDFIIKKCAT